MEKLKSIKETATILNVSAITIRRLIKQSKLVANKIGRQYRISEADLNNLLKSDSDGRK